MVRQSNELILAWSSLIGVEPNEGWRTISLEPCGPLEVKAGRRTPENLETVLIKFHSSSFLPQQKFPDGVGFSIEIIELDSDNQSWLTLSRKSAGSIELFTLMVCDVLGALDGVSVTCLDEPRLAQHCLNRVSAWQDFMKKGVQGLTPEEEVGLVGELHVFAKLISENLSPRMLAEGWLGPINGPQDFVIGTGAIEVKTTLSSTGFIAKVGSLEQLDDGLRAPLFVAGLRLAQSKSGQRLSAVVNTIFKLLDADVGAKILFSERLLAAGYFEAHSSRYTREFDVSEFKFFKVDEGFPRLIHGNVPLGVKKASYEIDLDQLSINGTPLHEVLLELGIN